MLRVNVVLSPQYTGILLMINAYLWSAEMNTDWLRIRRGLVDILPDNKNTW